MGFRKTRTNDAYVDRPPAAPPATEHPIDQTRMDRLLESSLRLRAIGVDYAAIQRRAETDGISFNDAVEALDAEHLRG